MTTPTNTPRSTRHWLSPLTTVFFAAISVTGLLMWLHVRVPGVRLLHEIAGLAFATVGLAHLILNGRVLCAYFRKRTAWFTLATGVLLCAALLVVGLAGGEQRGGRQRDFRRGPEPQGARPW